MSPFFTRRLCLHSRVQRCGYYRAAGCFVAMLTVALCVGYVAVSPKRFAPSALWHYLVLTYQCKNLDIINVADMAALHPCLDRPDRHTDTRPRSASSLHTPASSDIAGIASQALEAVEVSRAARQAAVDKWLYQQAHDWLTSSADHRREEKYSPFLPQLTLAERGRLLSTWRALHLAFAQHGIPYFLESGSLLGAVRHRGLIPWDDDIDVAVHVNYTHDMQRVLSCVPGYTLRVAPSMHWKFFATDSVGMEESARAHSRHPRNLTKSEQRGFVIDAEYEKARSVVMRYPFVDIFLVTSSSSCTRALAGHLAETVVFFTEDIYPLRLVPFEGYMAPVPRRARHILNMYHDDANVCRVTPGHNVQGPVQPTEVACQELAGMYPIYTV